MRRSVAIVTDSTADLPSDLARERRISVVPLTLILDGKSYLDGVDITPAEFYTRLATSRDHPTTSQPSPGRFAETYEQLLRDHQRVLSLHISSRLSGTYASAVQGAALVDGNRIRVVDTQAVSMWLSLLALGAASLADQGRDVDTIVRTLAEASSVTEAFFSVQTLEYLRRGGRIGRASALLGSVLQIKPILHIHEGQVAPLEQVRTRARAVARMVELTRGLDRGDGLCIVVAHAADPAAARSLAASLEDCAETLVLQEIGPVVGAHAGPGLIGVTSYPAGVLPLGLRRGLEAIPA